MENNSKIAELNSLILDSLLDRIKSGEKITASLLSQAIAYLKLHDISRLPNPDGDEEMSAEDLETLRDFEATYGFGAREKF